MRDIEQHLLLGKTLAQIGESIGVTRQRVHQIVAKLPNGKELMRRSNEIRLAEKQAKKDSVKSSKSDARARHLFGLSRADYVRLRELGAYRAYRAQHANAGKRGIDWGFTLASWWAVWEASGKWAQRGRGHGYVMARHGDEGPYKPENIYICTQVQNMKDSYVFKPAAIRKRGGVAQPKHLA